MDRVIQQAVAQVLMPIFDPTFWESSFGWSTRPQALQAAPAPESRPLHPGSAAGPIQCVVEGTGIVQRERPVVQGPGLHGVGENETSSSEPTC